jgi:pantoate--beta-alanine ligase
MKVIKSISEMKHWSDAQRANGLRIGFVPTMGFLHEGHLSLMRIAKENSDVVVASIFVNPTQFAPGEDFDRYPRDFDRDSVLCEKEGIAVIFFPSGEDMYPENHCTYIITDQLSQVLCGKSRPSHFKGVTTIVCKLFNIVKPHIAVFGQKDAQQAIILKRMVDDLNMDVEMIIAPIVREPDGLAMSSRNKYLSEKERREAIVLFRSLKMAEDEFGRNKIKNKIKIKNKMIKMIEDNSSGRIDYVEIVDGETLAEPTQKSKRILIALAVYFDQTRLIDNIIVEF